MMPSWAERNRRAITWQTGSNGCRVALLFIRYIALARLLDIETFGLYALASSLIELSLLFTRFGPDAAFLHRSPHVKNEQNAIRLLFTFHTLLIMGWALLILITLTQFELPPELHTALWVIALTKIPSPLIRTAQMVQVKRVEHRRIALAHFSNALFGTGLAVTLAVMGFELWALLAINILTQIIYLLFFYAWRPIWTPQFHWTPEEFRYMLTFGSPITLAGILDHITQRIDTLFTAWMGGTQMLGIYSRAYRLAEFPRILFTQPVNNVLPGSYAELKSHPETLRDAAVLTQHAFLTLGFLAAGFIVSTADPLIPILLGSKWSDCAHILPGFFLFIALEPTRQSLTHIFVSLGAPGKLVLPSALQLTGLCVALLVLGPRCGAPGIAWAMSLQCLLGFVLIYRRTGRLLNIPPIPRATAFGLFTIGLTVTIHTMAPHWETEMPPWIRLTLRALLFLTPTLFLTIRQWPALHRQWMDLREGAAS